jgi:hypothetical protein
MIAPALEEQRKKPPIMTQATHLLIDNIFILFSFKPTNPSNFPALVFITYRW